MKAIDQVLVEGQGEQFALLAPEVINDYVETLGKPCQNPLGYTAGSLILAKDLEGVQRMFKVTANISSSQNVVEGTNVERKKLEDLFDGINTELGSVKNALANEVATRAANGAHNLFDFEGVLKAVGTSYTKTNNIYSISNTYGLSSHPYQFSDTDVDVLFTFTMTTGTASNPRFDLLNSNDVVVASVTSSTTGPVRACKVRFNSSTNGSVTIAEPMIRLATDSNADFEPFAMTNQQLTDELSVEDASANVTSVDAAFSDIDILKTGKVVQITATLAAGTTAGVKQFKVTKYAPKMISTCNGVALSDAADAGKVISAQVLDSGWAYISLSSTLTDAVKVGFVYITA